MHRVRCNVDHWMIDHSTGLFQLDKRCCCCCCCCCCCSLVVVVVVVVVVVAIAVVVVVGPTFFLSHQFLVHTVFYGIFYFVFFLFLLS